MTSRLLGLLTLASLSMISVSAGAAEDECREALTRARTEADTGKLVAAGRSVEACTKETCAAEVRSECERSRTKIEEATPTTSFVVRDAQDRDLDALVLVDGAQAPLGRSTLLDPGLHEVSWTLADGTKGSRKITIVEGQRHRVVALVVADARPGAPPRRQAQRSAVPWVLFGAGGVLFGASAALQLLALQEDEASKQTLYHATRDDLSAQDSAAFYASAQDKYDAAVSNEAAAITCFALGTAAIAAGAVWLLLREGGTSARSPRVGLTPRGFGGVF